MQIPSASFNLYSKPAWHPKLPLLEPPLIRAALEAMDERVLHSFQPVLGHRRAAESPEGSDRGGDSPGYSLHSEVVGCHPAVVDVQNDLVVVYGCTDNLEKEHLFLVSAPCPWAQGTHCLVQPDPLPPSLFLKSWVSGMGS